MSKEWKINHCTSASLLPEPCHQQWSAIGFAPDSTDLPATISHWHHPPACCRSLEVVPTLRSHSHRAWLVIFLVMSPSWCLLCGVIFMVSSSWCHLCWHVFVVMPAKIEWKGRLCQMTNFQRETIMMKLQNSSTQKEYSHWSVFLYGLLSSPII